MEESLDWVVIGSGFGGAVSGLRLTEKGYRVLMLEKGRRFAPEDFPRSNWNLRRWLWMPRLGFRGLFQISFFRHLTAFTGVGVGGGSLVYANTLPTPPPAFFAAPSWAHLADWATELEPHYATALHMLGATPTPFQTAPDEALQRLASERGQTDAFHATRVGVFFGAKGQEGKSVPDPYFDGAGPERAGCTACGGCMIGCRVGAKNSLDQNYLHLAERLGMRIQAESEVVAVRAEAQGGYRLEVRTTSRGSWWSRKSSLQILRAKRVVFAGGVLGTVPLLLQMREDPEGLPDLSAQVGAKIRTNSEALLGVTTRRRDVDLSKGIAIGSILQTDEHSHLEPVRYPAGSGFFRLLMAPHAPGRNLGQRLVQGLRNFGRRPWAWLKAYCVRDWAKSTSILLYMRTEDATLRLGLKNSARRKAGGGASAVRSETESGPPPTADLPEATELLEGMSEELNGVGGSLVTETLLGIPSTAHILGGCAMGEDAQNGAIDAQHRLFGYPDCLVVDGSAISANPGVNPSLTITALAERAMAGIPNVDSNASDAPEPPTALVK
ncbi:MAG: GMC oxidoreductase [Planctomycetota bacterium]